MFQFISGWLERRREKKRQALANELQSLDQQVREIKIENINLLYTQIRITTLAPMPPDDGFRQRMDTRVEVRKRNNALLGELRGRRSRLERKLATLSKN